MRSRLIGLLVLALLVGAVAWQWHVDESDARAHTLTPLDPDAITRIEVALKGSTPQRFERRDGRWIAEDGGGAADQGRAGDLAALAATPVADWKPSAAFDPAKIGLAPPVAVLVLDDVRVDFGDLAALGRQRYARVGNRIAFIPAQALPRAERTAALPMHTSVPP
ncbi:hypothetical protein [Luteibacter sp. ME-Dv--P-043b]|jgi:hypothetical protein|uniref:hypothetical protein n=1 Tax=unclassified Luteibacter TaxID=2620188 RepID=UPI002556881E|nr:hypothetical protein [Luteibacter sp. ME-Dv--P-043b]